MLGFIKQQIRNYFGFSQTEANGFIILIGLMVLLLFTPSLYDLFYTAPPYNNQQDVRMLDSLVKIFESQEALSKSEVEEVRKKPYPKRFRFDPNTASKEDFTSLGIDEVVAFRIVKYREKGGKFLTKDDLLKIYEFPKSKYHTLRDFIDLPDQSPRRKKKKPEKMIKIEAFPFNPNKASKEDLLKLGLPPTVAQTIINYREKGGQFREKSDLLKIYNFPKPLFEDLEDFIDIPELSSPLRSSSLSIPLSSIDINDTDTAALRKIYGVGPFFSQNIVDYREKLGGFTAKSQFNEIYGLNEEVIQKLNEVCYISADFNPLKININTADITVLGRHPYISYSLARVIVSYRDQHGPFSTLEELREIHLMDSDTYQKLVAYCTL